MSMTVETTQDETQPRKYDADGAKRAAARKAPAPLLLLGTGIISLHDTAMKRNLRHRKLLRQRLYTRLR